MLRFLQTRESRKEEEIEMAKTTAADAKKALVAEYLELSEVKCGFIYSETDASDRDLLKIINKKPVIELMAQISKMRRMDDYAGASAAHEAFGSYRVASKAVATAVAVKTPDTATEAQVKFIVSLFSSKHGINLEDEKHAALLAGVKKLTKFKASKEIDSLKNLPTLQAVKPVSAPDAAPTGTVAIPDGIYAIQHDGEPKCYEISNGKAGTRWEGFIFLDRVSSDDRYSIRNRDEKARILDAIRADVEGAGRLAAQILKKCRGVSAKGRPCRRTLSDTGNPYYSYGYGPDCGPRFVIL